MVIETEMCGTGNDEALSTIYNPLSAMRCPCLGSSFVRSFAIPGRMLSRTISQSIFGSHNDYAGLRQSFYRDIDIGEYAS